MELKTNDLLPESDNYISLSDIDIKSIELNLYIASHIDLYLNQIKKISKIFEESIYSVIDDINDSVTQYLKAAEAKDNSVKSLALSWSGGYLVETEAWINTTSDIESALHEISKSLIDELQNNSFTVHNNRKEKLVSIKSKIKIYTDNIIKAQASFKKSSSKLEIAIKNIDIKTKEIDNKLTKLRDSNNSDMSKALGNTIVSRRTMENVQTELMETLKKKSALSMNNSVGRYLNNATD